MKTFDQRGQHVTYQYNAAGNIDIGLVQNKLELINELRKLQKEISTSVEHNALDRKSALTAEYELKNAVLKAEETIPEKPHIIEHLSKAKQLVSSVSGLAGAISQAIEKVTAFF